MLQQMTDGARAAGRDQGLRAGTLEEARAGYEMVAAAGGESPELAKVDDQTIPGPAGAIPIRVYTPVDDGPFPVVVFFHGGGFTIGSIDSHDPVARQLCAQVGAVVVSVGYRLAPEHKFPAAVDDAFAAVQWIAAHGAELGADGSRIALCGDSAGGNLSAVVSIMARDAGGPSIAFQALVYPATDARDDGAYPSRVENGDAVFLNADSMRWFYEQYGNSDDDRTDWRASPILAPDLTGLPPALVITAEYDVLRDEGEAYGSALQAAGNDVTIHRYEGMTHVFFQFHGILDVCQEATTEVAAAIKAALTTG
jgi:acetyl esterase